MQRGQARQRDPAWTWLVVRSQVRWLGENKVEELIVGARQNGKLVFVASLGNGFIPATRRQVYNALKSLKTDRCPFANVPEKKGRGHMDAEKMQEVTWVKPKLRCEAAFNEFTPDGHLRHGEFVRLLR